MTNFKSTFLTFLFLFTFQHDYLFSRPSSPGRITIVNPRTELRTNPLGIDISNPRLSWELKSAGRGKFQSAYEILVSYNPNDLEKNKGTIWHTGKVSSGSSFSIVYRGKPLKSFTRYFWKVRIRDEKNFPSEWSGVSFFETAMMNDSGWQASWISDPNPLPVNEEDFYKENPAPLIRKEIEINKEVLSARLYISGLGYYEASLNGEKIGDAMLDPGWTQYAKEVLYSTYDVTNQLQKGKNAIGIILGNGWYNPLPLNIFGFNLRNTLTVGKPCVKAQLRIVFRDGSIKTFITDSTWKTCGGPILKNNVYLGEMYDARKEQENWDRPGFTDNQWKNCIIIPGPAGKLTAQAQPPIRVTRILKPKNIYELKPGTFIIDFGQNFAGTVKLKVEGPAGTVVKIRCGEDVHADGSLNYFTNLVAQLKDIWNANPGKGAPRPPVSTITYILKGQGLEVYSPRFTFHSFRYLEITGFPGRPDSNSVEGLRMNSTLNENGSFECSNEMFNKVQEMVKWTFLSNVFSIQSDCPGREKFGYGADIVTTAEAFCYNFDMSNFYRKVLRDFANDARHNGGMTELAPFNGIADEGMGGGTGSPGWQLAFPFCLKVLYDYYGDIEIVKEYYNVLKKQIDFMHSVTPGNIVEHDIGDHESIDPKPISLSATAFYYAHVKILDEFAHILKKTDDASEYNKLCAEIREAFVKRFLKQGTGIFDSGTQAAQVIPLYYDLVPDTEKNDAINKLLQEIYGWHKGHLSTGIFGTKFLFEFFRRDNRNDAAYSIADQRGFPGYADMIAHGATTLYEGWKYPDTVNSQNHPMFGSVSEWFYKSILGINSNAPGFASFEIKPEPAGDLKWAKGYYDAVTGRINCDWKIESGHFYMHVTVPANTKAELYVPSLNNKQVLESGNPAFQSAGLKFKEYKDNYAVFEAGSGDYSFDSIYK
jgi:alpha-L-rhamnosidase